MTLFFHPMAFSKLLSSIITPLASSGSMISIRRSKCRNTMTTGSATQWASATPKIHESSSEIGGRGCTLKFIEDELEVGLFSLL